MLVIAGPMVINESSKLLKPLNIRSGFHAGILQEIRAF
jgi:hypothetical protein